MSFGSCVPWSQASCPCLLSLPPHLPVSHLFTPIRLCPHLSLKQFFIKVTNAGCDLPRRILVLPVPLFLSGIGPADAFLLETLSSCASVTVLRFSPYLTGHSFSVGVESSFSFHLKSKCGTTLWPSSPATFSPQGSLPSFICLLMTPKFISSTQTHALGAGLTYQPPAGHFYLSVELMSNTQLGQNESITFHLVSETPLIEI